MINRLEDVVGRLWVSETLPQVRDLVLKVLWLKELVWQSRKVHVEEICDLAVLETFGLTCEQCIMLGHARMGKHWLNTHLGQAVPDSIEVLLEGCGKVRQGCRTDMISDDEQQKGFVFVSIGCFCLCDLKKAKIDFEYRP